MKLPIEPIQQFSCSSSSPWGASARGSMLLDLFILSLFSDRGSGKGNSMLGNRLNASSKIKQTGIRLRLAWHNHTNFMIRGDSSELMANHDGHPNPLSVRIHGKLTPTTFTSIGQAQPWAYGSEPPETCLLHIKPTEYSNIDTAVYALPCIAPKTQQLLTSTVRCSRWPSGTILSYVGSRSYIMPWIACFFPTEATVRDHLTLLATHRNCGTEIPHLILPTIKDSRGRICGNSGIIDGVESIRADTAEAFCPYRDSVAHRHGEVYTCQRDNERHRTTSGIDGRTISPAHLVDTHQRQLTRERITKRVKKFQGFKKFSISRLCIGIIIMYFFLSTPAHPHSLD
ncbi:uncharacterized protein CLUP02_01366 [Colletotrichum lupini]|uniref:Uncharacterized protein n=1 Tax=Colletotrichum lupini TaxID=145971 RepID=A0A9Q8SCI7_9PEZI|nr:uncharacterized protein CLUP02_01366 [Colletotrichum lupini]UQC74714.1 hypothetical protein CLUP02_01366 [Colletotrichum lupini]